MEQELLEKLTRLGYPEHTIQPGEENVPLLFIQDRLICSITYALLLSDEDLQALIKETLL